MKRFMLGFVFLLLIHFAFAGEVARVSFDNIKEQTVLLGERDVIRFELGGKEHKIMLRELVEDKNIAKITVFIEDAETPYYTTINPKTMLQLDFERDDVIDMLVRYMGIKDGQLLLRLKLLEKEETTPVATGNGFSWWYYPPALVLILAMVWKRRFLLKRTRKIKRKLKI